MGFYNPSASNRWLFHLFKVTAGKKNHSKYLAVIPLNWRFHL